MSIQIRCLFKMFAANPTGQRALLLPPQSVGGLRGGGRWGRTIQGALIIVAPAVTWGGGWVGTEGLLLSFSHFVGDEAVARQGGE